MASCRWTRQAQALLFMRQCRQPITLPHLVSTARPASTAPSIPSVPVLDRSRRSTLAPLNQQKVSPKWGEKAIPVEKALEGPAPGSERISILGAVKHVLGFKPKVVSDYVPAPFTVYSNPYKARKAWPPNFDHLHPKHQFHYEKTYRRRMKLKYARPRFTMWTKLIQWTLIWGVTIYWVFIMQMEQNGRKVGTMWENFQAFVRNQWKNYQQKKARQQT